jgi:nitrogen-specific signal transduction histidine kinase
MMLQSAKMASVGGLAAGVAHEINNPLGVMMQSAQMLQIIFDLNALVEQTLALTATDLFQKFFRGNNLNPKFLCSLKIILMQLAWSGYWPTPQPRTLP